MLVPEWAGFHKLESRLEIKNSCYILIENPYITQAEMNDLATNRAEIDEIDNEILALLKKRAEKCLKIKEIKAREKISTQDKKREEEILKKCKGQYELEIYRKILQESRNLQK